MGGSIYPPAQRTPFSPTWCTYVLGDVITLQQWVRHQYAASIVLSWRSWSRLSYCSVDCLLATHAYSDLHELMTFARVCEFSILRSFQLRKTVFIDLCPHQRPPTSTGSVLSSSALYNQAKCSNRSKTLWTTRWYWNHSNWHMLVFIRPYVHIWIKALPSMSVVDVDVHSHHMALM